jgi:protein SCO1/2
VILSLVYFSCPGLCNFHLNGLTDGMKKMDWQIGDKFQVVSLSIDPREGSELASKKKETYIKLLGKPEAANGWHFLTADEPVIKKLAATVGFKYRWDEKNKEWAHASAAIIVTPDGKISRYLHGILFEPKDLKLALLEASNGKIGTLTDRLVWYCYKYDAHKSQYSIMAIRLVQIGGGLMVLVLASVLLPFWWRSRKESQV